MKSKNVFDNLIEAIGHTPLVKLHNFETKAQVYSKLEGFNPGLSSKDRTVLYMMRDAIENGNIGPNPTFIEATSGNTGFSLAMICSIKNFSCILTVPDKISKEKIDALKALGAVVHVCPSKVMPEDPQSYHSRAQSLSEEIQDSIFLNQYYNKSNIKAHYETTGPEIWDQTDGKITHFIAGVGTGGTLSGVGRFLKEKNPDLKVYGVDAFGSVLTHYHETGEIDYDMSYSYKIEGIGKNFIPANIDFPIIDRFIQVGDNESAVAAKSLATKEGILAGYSSGAVMSAFMKIADELKDDDLVVVLLPDHGLKYLSKIFNEDWLTANALHIGSTDFEDHNRPSSSDL